MLWAHYLAKISSPQSCKGAPAVRKRRRFFFLAGSVPDMVNFWNCQPRGGTPVSIGIYQNIYTKCGLIGMNSLGAQLTMSPSRFTLARHVRAIRTVYRFKR